jgi:hypothetical protein
MRLLLSVFTVLGLAALYVGSAVVFMWLVHIQLVPPQTDVTSVSVGRVFVHPGLISKLSSALAIVVTWVALAARRGRSNANRRARLALPADSVP